MYQLFLRKFLSHSYQLSIENNSTNQVKLNYLNFISERLLHHYSHHHNEIPPMLSVSEFLNLFSKNQLVIRISVQIDDFIELDYPSGSHIHFDDDSVQLTNCKVSPQNYLFIIEGITKTEQEIKLFWGEKTY